MFKITDYTIRPPRITISNDVKDVADIVLGISGSEEIASKVLDTLVVCNSVTQLSRIRIVLSTVFLTFERRKTWTTQELES